MLECFSKTVYIHLSRSVVEGFLAGLTFRFQSKIPSTVHSAILIKILTKFIFLILDIIKYRNNDTNQNLTAITMVISCHLESFGKYYYFGKMLKKHPNIGTWVPMFQT